MSVSLQHFAGSTVLIGLLPEGAPLFMCIVAFKNGTPVYAFKLQVREPATAYFS